MKQYRLRIKEIAIERGIENANQLRLQADLTRKPAYEIWDGTSQSLTLPTINKLCDLFDCEPGDLYEEIKPERKRKK